MVANGRSDRARQSTTELFELSVVVCASSSIRLAVFYAEPVSPSRVRRSSSKMCSGSSSRALCAVLILIGAVHSDAQSSVAAEVSAPTTVAAVDAPIDEIYDLNREHILKCDLTRPDATQRVVWSKNGTEIAPGERYHFLEDGSQLRIAKAQEEDYGDYACRVGNSVRSWRLAGRTHVKLPANSNVVEGQKLKLTCRLVGKPYPPVQWLYGNDTHNDTDVAEVLGARVAVNTSEHGVPGAEFVLLEARREDAGRYTCVAGAANATTTVRVKDMYAALWPFLGICAEVFVLCAIILVYEKRRTKPELDDSDTDNHDQKKS